MDGHAGHGSSSLSRTVDGGTHWQAQLALPYPKLFQRDMSMINDQIAFVAVGAPVASKLRWRLFSTTDGGQVWTPHELPDGGAIAGLDFVTDSEGWVLQTNADGVSTLFRTGDGGRSWAPCTDRSSGAVMIGVRQTDHLEGVRFASSRVGWIAGWETGSANAAGPLYDYTSDGCQTWQAMPLTRGHAGSGPEQPILVDLPGDMAGSGAAGAVTVRQLDVGTTSVSVFTSRTGARDRVETQVQAARTRAPVWSVAGTGVVTIGDNVMTGRSVSRQPMPSGSGVLAAQFSSSTTGFIQSLNANGSVSLLRTEDAGRHWTTVSTW
jgi:hypothetical protein